MTKKTIKRLEFHEYSYLLPDMSESEYAAFRRDVAARGLEEEIVLYEGKILDGRHRFRACKETGVKPRFREFDGPDPVAFVLSANLHRRHLDESQRAMIAARLATMKQGARTDLAQNCAKSQTEAAKALNVSRRSVQQAKIVLGATPELINEVVAGKLPVSLAAELAVLPRHKQRMVVKRIESRSDSKVSSVVRDFNRAEKFAEIRRQARELGSFDGPYAVIYADPPWRFGTDGCDHAPENHYPTMTTDEICAIRVFDRPVGELALPDSVLLLWVPPSLVYPEAMRVIEGWGFKYLTHLVWDKGSIRIGSVIRNQHEDLILAKRGAFPAPETLNRPSSVIQAPVTGHSAKPPIVRAMIDRMYPGVPKIELFARGEEPEGWRFWGYEARPRRLAASGE